MVVMMINILYMHLTEPSKCDTTRSTLARRVFEEQLTGNIRVNTWIVFKHVCRTRKRSGEKAQ